MLEAAGRPHGMAASYETFDTLDISRRLLSVPRYTLAHLAEALNLKAKPSHRAQDDVAATVELVQRLASKLRAGEVVRRQAIARHAKSFADFSCSLQGWREAARVVRPPDLLRRVLDESGLPHYYQREDEPRRIAHLEELVRLFEAKDDPALAPIDSLWELMALTSLGSDLDRQAGDEDRVRLLTVHQAKGLEFDTVFVASANDNEFPLNRSVRDGREPEEHRLFYVAISRAKRRLLISYTEHNKWGKWTSPSRYLRFLEGR